MAKKVEWKPIGKQKVRELIKYREFETLDICDSESSISMPLVELQKKVAEWIKLYGRNTEIYISPTNYETVNVTLSRPVPSSKETTEL